MTPTLPWPFGNYYPDYGAHAKFLRTMQVTITCVDCAGTWTADDQTLPAALEKGDVIQQTIDNPGWTYTTYFAVCESCQSIFKAAARKPKQRPSVELEALAIQQRIAVIREKWPEMSLERAAHMAVEDQFDALNEPNPAFRRWLIEHER